MTENPDEELNIVKKGIGGTGFPILSSAADWNAASPSTDLAGDFKTQALTAIAALQTEGKSVVILGMFWTACEAGAAPKPLPTPTNIAFAAFITFDRAGFLGCARFIYQYARANISGEP